MNLRKLLTLAVVPLAMSVLSAPGHAYQVRNGKIFDDANQEVRLAGVNWFGFETSNLTPHGLWARNWTSMIDQMQQLGFNAVRLPFCPATLKNNAPNSIDYSKNPDLAGLTSLQLLDKMVAEFDRRGMYVLLDHHRPDCNAISELWYINGYSEAQWIDDLVFVARRYQNVPHVVGIDLKNEPHGAATWGSGNAATDWDGAAARAGSAVLAANPRLLVWVEGIEGTKHCSSQTNHWWGGNLEPIRCAPLKLPADKVALSPHVYGPDVFSQPYFSAPNFPENMPDIWEQHFGFLATQGRLIVPGEFGGRYGHGGDPRDKVLQDKLVDYFVQKGVKNFFYWSWNPNSGDTGGILQDDWQTPWADKVTLLKKLMDNTPPPDLVGVNLSVSQLDVPAGGSAQFTVALAAAPKATLNLTVQRVSGNSNLSVTSGGSLSFSPNDWSQPRTVVIAAGPNGSGEDTAQFLVSGAGAKPATLTARELRSPRANCTVSVDTSNDWGAGYVGRVVLRNTGTAPINGWQISWTASNDFTLVNSWSGNFVKSGRTVTVTPASWNQTIPPQGSADLGLQVSYSGAKPVPDNIQTPGLGCDVVR